METSRYPETLYALFESMCFHLGESADIVEACRYDDGQSILRASYSDIRSVAHQVAHSLRDIGVKEVPVGVCIKPQLYIPAILIGIMSVPASYCPLDITASSYFTQALTSLNIQYMTIDSTYIQLLKKHGMAFEVISSNNAVYTRCNISLIHLVGPESSLGTQDGRVNSTSNAFHDVTRETSLKEPVVCCAQINDQSGLKKVARSQQAKREITSASSSIPVFNKEIFRSASLEPVRRTDAVSQSGSSIANSIAYCITSSGTTGQAKTIRVPHSCIVPNIIDFRKLFAVNQDDLCLLASPLTFDPSVIDIFTSLSSGATLLIIPDIVKVIPRHFVAITTKRNRVTIMQVTPSLLYSIPPDTISTTLLRANTPLRVLALGGEPCPSVATISSWRGAGNHTRVYNLYGTTEVSCWATYEEIALNNSSSVTSVPVGRPLSDTRIEIRNHEGEVIKEGTGEIFIGGERRVCLVNDEAWPRDDPMRPTGDLGRMIMEGDVYFVGRVDHRCKRNGMLLDLTLLEQTVSSVGDVTNSACIYDNRMLVVFVCIASGSGRVLSEIDARISDCLPRQYRPDRIEVLSALPRTKHGKVDRYELARVFSERKQLSRVSFDEGSIKDLLMKAWKDCLGLDSSGSVADSDNFVLNGGDSLAAVRLTNSLESVTGINLPELLDLVLNKIFADVYDYVRGSIKNSEPALNKDSLTRAALRDKSLAIEVREGGDGSNKSASRVHGIVSSRECDGVKNECIIGGSLAKRCKSEVNKIDRTNKVRGKSLEKVSFTESVSVEIGKNPGSGVPGLNFCTACYKLRRKVYENAVIGSVGRGNNTSCCFCCRDVRMGKQIDCHNERSEYKKIVHVMSCDAHPFASPSESDVSARHGQKITPTPVWTFDTGKCVDASPLLVLASSMGDSLVIIGSHSHRCAALRPLDGQCVWVTTLGGRVESSACLSNCGRFAVVGCYDHFVYTLNIKDGFVHWKFKTGAEVKSSPVVNPITSLVYIGSHDQNLYALNIETMECVWSVNLSAGSIFSSPCLSLQPYQLYAATLHGSLVALKPDTGDEVWRFDAKKPLFSSAATCPDWLVVGCVDGCVYCFSHAGKQLWMYNVGGPVFSCPVIMNRESGRIIITGSHNNSVVCLTEKPQVLWEFSTDSPVYSTPFIVDLCCSSRVYCAQVSNSKAQMVDSSSFEVSDDSSIGTIYNTVEPFKGNNSGLIESKSDSLYDQNTDVNPYSPSSDRNIANVNICSTPPTCTTSPRSLVTFNTTRGTIYHVDCASGALQSRIQLPNEVFSSSVCFMNYFWLGCRDNNLYCFEYNPILINPHI